MRWPWQKKQESPAEPVLENRAVGSGFTAEIIAARESYISGRRGIGELTATAQSCVSLWEGAMALADVSGTDLLDRRSMALVARSVALPGGGLGLEHPWRRAEGLSAIHQRSGWRHDTDGIGS
jgi:hypothetical protein